MKKDVFKNKVSSFNHVIRGQTDKDKQNAEFSGRYMKKGKMTMKGTARLMKDMARKSFGRAFLGEE